MLREAAHPSPARFYTGLPADLLDEGGFSRAAGCLLPMENSAKSLSTDKMSSRTAEGRAGTHRHLCKYITLLSGEWGPAQGRGDAEFLARSAANPTFRRGISPVRGNRKFRSSNTSTFFLAPARRREAPSTGTMLVGGLLRRFVPWKKVWSPAAVIARTLAKARGRRLAPGSRVTAERPSFHPEGSAGRPV